MKEGLIKKFLKFSYGSWLGLILGLFTTMFTTRILNPDDFGKASLFELFLKLGLIFTIFGTDQSFVRFFYEEDLEKRGTLLYNSLKLPIISTTVLSGMILIFYSPITYFLIGNQSFLFAVVLSIGIFFQAIFRYGKLVIRMQQKGNLYSIIQILRNIFKIILIILLFILIGSRFEILIYSNVITLFILSLLVIYLGKDFWNLKNAKVKDVKHSQREIITYGAPFVLTIFITWLFESFDKIALRQWSDFGELGLYSAAMRLVALVMVLKQTFSTFWVPVAYEKFENNPKDKDFFRHISIIVSFLMFIVAIMSIAGKEVIITFLGSQFGEAAAIMPFLIFMPLFYTISEVTVMGINFYKKTKWHIVISALACVTNILGNWLLVPKHGAIGASVATAFSFIVFFTVRTQISQKFYKVNFPLTKIYLMVGIVSTYAVYSIFSSNIWMNVSIGILLIILSFLLYYKDLLYIYKNRKAILG